jgi:alpha/beta superfamily hydrolase
LSQSGTVYFAHGKESGPWGVKIQALAKVAQAQGFAVESPDYQGIDDPEARVEKLLGLHPHDPNCLVLVGSSMGAYVSTVASASLKPAGLFLMAPAFYRDHYRQAAPQPEAGLTVLVHGWEDAVVPVDVSVRFAQAYQTELHLIHGDHRLEGPLATIERLFEDFLRRVK